MSYRVGVKPGKALSAIGMIVGIAFVLLGIFVAIPLAGPFGILWTVVALAITLYHSYNAFSSRGAPTYDVNIDGGDATAQFDADLRKLAKLKEDGLLSAAEFEKKRSDLMRQ
jgi:hypothetical protein